VEICKSGALTFEEPAAALKRKTDEVSRSVSRGAEAECLSPGFALLNAIKRVQVALQD
jgi:carbon-monoxide dehydrogenase iron sulfur subunit